jgi:LacI family transcriptional regulator
MLNQAIEEIAIPLGYNVLVCNSYRDKEIERYYLELLTDNFLVDGIVYATSPTYPELVKKISALIPVVVIGDKDDQLEIDTVSLNSYKGGMLAAEHLVKLGHEHIAFITTPFENVSLSRKQRFDGIQDKLAEYGLKKNLIVKISKDEHESSDGVYEIEVGYALTKELLNENTPVSAIIGVNDIAAGGIMNALSDEGYKVPQQFSVCGFDNTFISSILQPKLTTVDHRVQHRAKTGVTLLIEKIERLTETTPSAQLDDPGVYKIEYEPQLIVRNSTGPVKK